MLGFHILAVGFAVAAGHAAGYSSVSVSYALQGTLTLHEPVVVTASIRNHLPEPVEVDLGWNRIMGFGLVVHGPDGQVRRPTIIPSDLGRGGRLSIAPGQQISQPLVLNDWLPFDRPGLYQVEIRLTAPIRAASGGAVAPPAPEVLDILVGGRNETVLHRTYQRLADDFSSAVGADWYDALQVLRHVNDPVGVPILRNVLDMTTRGDPVIIEALKRTGTSGAQQLLQELAQSSRKERAALARNALIRLKMR